MTTRVRLPDAAWRKVLLWTGVIIGGSVVLSDVASTIVLSVLGNGINEAGLVAATLMPIILGGPMMFYQALRHQQLKHLNAQLDILASIDWLTDCLNRRAFTAKATERLNGAEATGTLLVIDADHFKAVNDRFGHEAGDEALQLMARTIRSTVRETDFVGRLGGEEFGVFLAGADFTAALVMAERIRFAVSRLHFAPNGESHALSVSIGGAAAVPGSGFTDLLRMADQQLYGAKAAGRNRIELVVLGTIASPGTAAVVAAA
jgi:diguanylate cyclase (GGDEF)-like protein